MMMMMMLLLMMMMMMMMMMMVHNSYVNVIRLLSLSKKISLSHLRLLLSGVAIFGIC